MVLNCQDYMNWEKEESYDNLMNLVMEYKLLFDTNIEIITGNRVGYAGNNVEIIFKDETKLNMWEFKNGYSREDSKFQISVDYHGRNKDFIELVNLINKYVNIN